MPRPNLSKPALLSLFEIVKNDDLTQPWETYPCVLWTGRSTEVRHENHVAEPAYRAAYQLVHGELKPWQKLRHHCCNLHCIRPVHLYYLTKRVSTPRETRYQFLVKQMDSLSYDPLLPWTSYPCLDWPFGFSVPKGNMEHGYGVVCLNNKQVRLTRIVFERFHRPLGADESVLHYCDRPICWHPAHLWAGSQADNVKDCVAKERHCYGERSGMCKLTDAEVVKTRELLAQGSSQTEIARIFGVSKSLIWRIQHGFLRKKLSSDYVNHGVSK